MGRTDHLFQASSSLNEFLKTLGWHYNFLIVKIIANSELAVQVIGWFG